MQITKLVSMTSQSAEIFSVSNYYFFIMFVGMMAERGMLTLTVHAWQCVLISDACRL